MRLVQLQSLVNNVKERDGFGLMFRGRDLAVSLRHNPNVDPGDSHDEHSQNITDDPLVKWFPVTTIPASPPEQAHMVAATFAMKDANGHNCPEI